MKGVYTSVCGNNTDLMKQVASKYLKPGYRIADVTYGKGVFWKKINTTDYDLCPSDLITCPKAPFDFRSLPYPSGSFDAVVLDPPYMHHPGKVCFEANYRNSETTKGLDHAGIIGLYEDGMRECVRILKPGGLLLVKCKDEIESGRQRVSHFEVLEIALRLGMVAQDLFILTHSATRGFSGNSRNTHVKTTAICGCSREDHKRRRGQWTLAVLSWTAS